MQTITENLLPSNTKIKLLGKQEKVDVFHISYLFEHKERKLFPLLRNKIQQILFSH